jgi:hypothetical protein
MAEGEQVLLLEWHYPELPANINLKGPIAQIVLPPTEAKRFELILKVPAHPEMNSTYPLAIEK